MTVHGAPEGFDACLIAKRAQETGAVIHIARDDARLARLAEAIGFFAPSLTVLRFPAWDCLPYDRVSPNPAIIAERVATLTRLQSPAPGPLVLLTTINAAIQRVMPAAQFAGISRSIAPGSTLDLTDWARFLESQGYHRVGTVMEQGDFAIRGGIFDVWPAGDPTPARIDLFGDQVEQMRSFDPVTQRSATPLTSLAFHPASEIPRDAESISRFRSAYRDRFGADSINDQLYQAISAGHRHPGMEHYAPLFTEAMPSLFDALPHAAISLDHQLAAAAHARFEMVADHFDARRAPTRPGDIPYRPIPPDLLYLDETGFDTILNARQTMRFDPFSKPDTDPSAALDAGARPGAVLTQSGASSSVFDEFRLLVRRWQDTGRRVVLAAWSQGSRDRLASLLRDHGLSAIPIDHAGEVRIAQGNAVLLAVLGLERGFIAEDMVVIAEQDLLGARIARPKPRRPRADQFIADATETAEGDLVVHQEHGIGRYDGLVTLTVDGAPHDCLRLLYDGGDKLFLPVENIELLSRFGTETAGVSLDKLGGASWQARHAKAKNRIRDIAAGLIRLAAERKLHDAPLLAADEGSFAEFCARFPYTETEDQTRAIADVLEDLATGKPMDRLICGDVGFGKTEVALRAAFIAAMAGTQVAVVVPTTLLARQHYRLFAERFAGLPIKVAQLSRLVSAKDANAVRAGLADGQINIVIGTHALLAKSIAFAQLGLLIVDEEQHFGVAHKERLKQLKADVHVLTLTATPIPRTLQLALTGVRDLSLITTPPVDRLAVRTFIMPWDPLVIREALARERFRSGQIFCVVPHIDDLDRMRERLAEIAPDARCATAHGRLPPSEIERVMTEFSEGKYDILLATNIIESGLDMPAVNTILIWRADLFGHAGLYHLRGRVGRGKQRGYAYLTWPATHKLAASAQKRLEVMQTLDTLGAGFTLASHDLDLRGAGNLLGDEQSGHIREVGIELYQQMLEDAVADLRAEGGAKSRDQSRDWTPNISLGLPVLIPESYVTELPVRLGLYRRIGALTTDADSEALAAELVDRFGKLPEEVENLLATVALKRACRESGVEKLEAGPKGMVIGFRRNNFSNPAGLLSYIATTTGQLRLRPDHKLVMLREMTVQARLTAARDVITTLQRLATQPQAA